MLRREEAGWTGDDQAELEAWLDAAAEHKVAYWRLEHGWGKADRIAALGGMALRDGSSHRLKLWRPLGLAASIAACLALGAVAIPAIGLLGQRTYATEIGARETIPLSDGTKVELNTGSQLRTQVSTRARNVWLDRGEAYFEVAHDASRPFVVHAGAKTVTVLGTKFSVRRDGDQVEVAVVEGRVRVEDAKAATAHSAAIVTRGDIVIAQGASTLVTPKSIEKVSAQLSWRQGRLTFDQSTLADAANEFNRYNRKKLVITDPAAAAIRIGGSFDAENVDVFVRLLQRGFGLKVEDDGDTVKVSE